MRMQQTCEYCNGKGKFPKTKCPYCHGHKTVSENKSFNVQIEKGISDNHSITFKGEGDSVVNALPGDVEVTVRITPDANFERKGDDLYTKLNISFKEAILGFNKNIIHLDGRVINVSKAGTS